MTKKEYIKSLVYQNIPGDKMFELVRQWEIDNPQTEEVEEVKEEVVADQAGAAVKLQQTKHPIWLQNRKMVLRCSRHIIHFL